MKGIIFGGIVLISCGASFSQLSRVYDPQASATSPLDYTRQDLEVSLEPLDSALIAFGLTTDEVDDVLKLSVESTGWELRQGSENVITVKLMPLRQRQEDLFTFQIDVAVGAPTGRTLESPPGLTASSTIDVPAGGNIKLLAQINQLVTKVSRRFRQEVMKRSFQRSRSQTPDGIMDRGNEQLSNPQH